VPAGTSINCDRRHGRRRKGTLTGPVVGLEPLSEIAGSTMAPFVIDTQSEADRVSGEAWEPMS